MNQFFENVRKQRILVIGDIMLDCYLFGSANRLSPEAPVPVVELEKEEYRLGGAANVAANIASLGADVVLSGVVGHNYGDQLDPVLRKHEISPHYLVFTKDRPTTTKTRVVVNNHHVARIDREVAEPISKEHRDALLELLKPRVEYCSAVIISDYAKGVVSSTLLREVAQMCFAHDKPMVIDPKPKNKEAYSIFKSLKYLPQIILTPNKGEVYQLVGFSANTDLVDAVYSLMNMLACYQLAITLGKEGVFVYDFPKGLQEMLPTVAQHVFDVTGAGDTLIAALTLGIACGMDLLSAAKVANVAAGIAVEEFGTVAVTLKELGKRMDV